MKKLKEMDLVAVRDGGLLAEGESDSESSDSDSEQVFVV